MADMFILKYVLFRIPGSARRGLIVQLSGLADRWKVDNCYLAWNFVRFIVDTPSRSDTRLVYRSLCWHFPALP